MRDDGEGLKEKKISLYWSLLEVPTNLTQSGFGGANPLYMHKTDI